MKNYTQKIEEALNELIIKCGNEITINKELSDFNLSEDLGFDSINLIELVVEIESKFNIEIDDDFFVLDNLNSYRKLVNYIKNKIGNYDEKN